MRRRFSISHHEPPCGESVPDNRIGFCESMAGQERCFFCGETVWHFAFRTHHSAYTLHIPTISRPVVRRHEIIQPVCPPLTSFRVWVMPHCLILIIPLSHAAMWTEIREGDCAGDETREGASVSAGNWCQGEPCPPRLDDDMWRSFRVRPLCAISCRCIPRQRGIPRQDSCGRAQDSLARRYISGRDGSGDARGCQRMPRS